MAISVFDTRTMLEALEMLREPKTFLLNTFFKGQNEFPTESVDIDIYKGKRRVAVYVNPKGAGQVVDRTGYKTNTYKPPYVKPKMPTTAEDLLKRQAGEVMYANNLSPEQRAAMQLGKDMAELDAMITRREELQAREALFDGKVTVKDIDGNEIVDEIDFGREVSHTIDLTATGKTPWDASGADLLADIRAWRRQNIQDSGVSSNIVIMGSDVVDLFMGSVAVRTQLDKQTAQVGELQMRAMELGVTFIGRIEGVDYYAYDEWFFNDITGLEEAIVPAKKVLVGSTMARCERLYGAIRDVEAGLAAVARYPKSWIEQDPSVRWIQLHSAPLCVPHQVDAFTVATVMS